MPLAAPTTCCSPLYLEPFRPAVEVMKPGTYVTLRNAKVDMFRGSMRLAVNQVGAGQRPKSLLQLCV